MKSKNIIDIIKACRDFSISKDETRFSLRGVCFDEVTKKAVSTNGHVLTASGSLYREELKGLIVSLDLNVIGAEFPKWEMVVPKKNLKTLKFTIEKRHVIKDRDIKKRYIFFYDNGPIVEDGLISFGKKENYLFCLDSAFLKPIAEDREYTVHYIDAKSPVIFDFGDMHDYYIIMPISL